MTRLTIRNSDGSVSQPTHSTFEKVFNRLAEYEDLGKTPDELREILKLVEQKKKHHVQIAVDNYDILHNDAVKRKYPKLYDAVHRHDKISTSSWYELTDEEFEEFGKYVADKEIPYIK